MVARANVLEMQPLQNSQQLRLVYFTMSPQEKKELGKVPFHQTLAITGTSLLDGLTF